MPTPYSESTVVTTTARAVAPFALTYGVYVVLHGADSPGGGFQGGVIAASVFVMMAFAFGIRPTREWIDGRALVALVAGGVLVFAGVLLSTMALGGDALELPVLPVAVKWSVELVELSIGAIVTGVVTGLFFLASVGPRGEEE